MDTSGAFDGFMPLINDVVISGKTASITSDGELVDVYCLTLKTQEKDYIFSMVPSDMHKLYFLLMKVLSS